MTFLRVCQPLWLSHLEYTFVWLSLTIPTSHPWCHRQHNLNPTTTTFPRLPNKQLNPRVDLFHTTASMSHANSPLMPHLFDCSPSQSRKIWSCVSQHHYLPHITFHLSHQPWRWGMLKPYETSIYSSRASHTLTVAKLISTWTLQTWNWANDSRLRECPLLFPPCRYYQLSQA